jgi:phosphonoacetaldehyde hydrolase
MEISRYLEYNRRYKGPVKLVVLDWAGLTVDFGCYAPAVVFIEVFRRKGVDISMEQARGPMGRYKREHIKCIFEWYPDVSTSWKEKHGRDWTEEDVDDMFENLFKPIQVEVIRDYSRLIPGRSRPKNGSGKEASRSDRRPGTSRRPPRSTSRRR